jgi:ATP-dependent DNA helicase RecQ
LDRIKEKYYASKNFKKIQRVVELFINNNDYLTLSIWNDFLNELDIRIFEEYSNFNISTIHKSKGKEFDNVIMMLHNVKENNYFKRLYYVGMTRAKHNLYMISNNRHFDMSDQVKMKIQHDKEIYTEPNLLTLLMNLKDIYLNFTSSIELSGRDIIAGSKVKLVQKYQNKPRILFLEHDSIAQLSKGFEAEVTKYENRGYKIIDIEIESVVHWDDKKRDISKKHPLCKLVMKKL